MNRVGVIAVLSLLSLAGAPTPTHSNDLENNRTLEWKQKMQGLYESLINLLTDVTSDQTYYDPKNAPRIEDEIKKLSSLTHDIDATKDMKQDPTLPLFSSGLKNELKEAEQAFSGGHLGYARGILRSVPGECIACHTRNEAGASFTALPWEPPKKNLTPLERAEFFAATRQFDRALDGFQKLIRENEVSEAGTWDLDRGAREALEIAVRIKRSPKLAEEVIDSINSQPDAPPFLKANAKEWKKSISEWKKKEKKNLKSEEALHREAIRLFTEARTHQNYDLDHSQDIVYLRTSSTLYDLIQAAPTGKYVTEAFMILGLCYQVLNPRHPEDLYNAYYESCIRRAPHTSAAGTCYLRYEQSMYAGFSGSSGTHLPPEVAQKLRDLKALAQVHQELKYNISLPRNNLPELPEYTLPVH